MVSGIVSVVALVFLIFFAFYKRDMLSKMFSLNASVSANQFQQQLEQTTNLILKRLEDQISHLEYLLQEADEKIATLDERLQHYELQMQQTEKHNSGIEVISAQEEAKTEDNVVNNENEMLSNLESNSFEFENNDKRRLILTMADQGYNVTEIAKATGIGKGEVMLLLQLNKK